jgi:spore coat protein A, manganese oxidase
MISNSRGRTGTRVGRAGLTAAVATTLIGLPVGISAAASAPAPPVGTGSPAGTGIMLPATTPPTPNFSAPLPVLPTIDATGGGRVALDEVSGNHSFSSSLPSTPSWGFVPAGTTPAGAYLGPTIETMRGKPVDMTVTNKLGPSPTGYALDTKLMGVLPSDASSPRTSIHLHGAHDAVADDGAPEDVFGVGTSRTYHYGMDQQAGTLWYHDHALGQTRLNNVNGLAGTMLVRDQYDTGRAGNAAGLPSGSNEMPLVLQDKTFNPNGTINYDLGTPQSLTEKWIPEYFGDTALVNGAVTPNLPVDRGIYRFHLLNASNARFYNLSVPANSGAAVYQVGQGAGLLNAPVKMNNLLIAPSDRADVIIDFRGVKPGAKVVLGNDAVTPYPAGPRQVHKGSLPLPNIMQFSVGTGPVSTATVPTSLRGRPGQAPVVPAPASAAVQRTVFLNEILDPATSQPQAVLLNNQRYDDTTHQVTPHAGQLEQWNIINLTGDAHPIHLHLVDFQILSRQSADTNGYTAALNKSLPGPGLPDPSAIGLGPWPIPDVAPFLKGAPTPSATQEKAWTDVVIANPGEVVSIVAAYGGSDTVPRAPYSNTLSDPAGMSYVWHCHILEHEDNDMMQHQHVM